MNAPGQGDALPALRIAPSRLRESVNALPALPQAALAALSALEDERGGARHWAAPIASDPALAVRTLRLANSPFYGAPGRIGNVPDAVRMLGRHTLGTLVRAAMVASQFPSALEVPGFVLLDFWRHALAAALAARAIARATGHDEEQAFTAGLLHDIGRLVLATHFAQPLAQALAAAAAADLPERQAELALLGVDHAALGAEVARHWKLPETLAQALHDHHAPPDAPHPEAGAGPSLAAVVHLADAVAHALDVNAAPRERVPSLAPVAAALVQTQPALLLAVFEEVEAQLQALCDTLGLQHDA